MYPIGMVSIGAYLERNGIHTRIINIANRMLKDRKFNAEDFISKLSAKAFGIDLHWLPHAHGSLELASIVKKYHPSTPLIMGGLSSTYFHKELIAYPHVDFIVRGDSTETPMLQLMKSITSGKAFDVIPNLSWKDKSGVAHHNPLSFVPESLDVLASWPVIAIAAFFFCADSLADKYPFVDNLWDSVHTIIRPCGAASSVQPPWGSGTCSVSRATITPLAIRSMQRTSMTSTPFN
jgi:radical SAM superfamily enzyme YgiQ (UPF0313 family)